MVANLYALQDKVFKSIVKTRKEQRRYRDLLALFQDPKYVDVCNAYLSKHNITIDVIAYLSCCIFQDEWDANDEGDDEEADHEMYIRYMDRYQWKEEDDGIIRDMFLAFMNGS
jgi:hypothetical protein